MKSSSQITYLSPPKVYLCPIVAVVVIVVVRTHNTKCTFLTKFWVYNTVLLIIGIMLYHSLGHIHLAQLKLYTSSTTPHFCLPPTPGNHYSIFCIYEFDNLNITYMCKLSQSWCEIMWYSSFCDCLISLSIMSYRFIHVVANGRTSFSFKAEWYSILGIPYFLIIHFSMDIWVVSISWVLWIMLQKSQGFQLRDDSTSGSLWSAKSWSFWPNSFASQVREEWLCAWAQPCGGWWSSATPRTPDLPLKLDLGVEEGNGALRCFQFMLISIERQESMNIQS